MKEKWNKFGKWLVRISGAVQLIFCILFTCLFIETYPKLNDLSQPWGKRAINTLWQRLLWLSVVIKASYQIMIMSIEMFILWRANLGLQREIRRQKIAGEEQRDLISVKRNIPRSVPLVQENGIVLVESKAQEKIENQRTSETNETNWDKIVR